MPVWIGFILGIALLLAVAFAVVLLMERTRLGERLSSAERERDAAKAEGEGALQRWGDTQASLTDSERRVAALGAELAGLNTRLAELQRGHEDRIRDLQRTHTELKTEFKAIIDASASEALRKSGEQLLKLAGERFTADRSTIASMVKPIGDTLEETKKKLSEIDAARAQSFGKVSEQIDAVRLMGDTLRLETSKLVQALRKPEVRGRYGEIQLRRVVELAGMRAYCDFNEQESSRDAEGRLLRPDLVVKLPNERCIAVDSKTNIDAYMAAVETSNADEASGHLDRFARAVAEQAKALAEKKYWSSFNGAPEFTVMFIPGDQFIDAALQRRPELLDAAAQHGVILASPSTLIGLLRAVAVGWREKRVSDNANDLFKLGRELHDRAGKILEDIARVGKAIDAAARAHNDLVGSVDSRLTPTLRKFEESGAKSNRELTEPVPLEVTIRPVRALPSTTGDTNGA